MDMGGELNVVMGNSGVDVCTDFDSCCIPHNMRWANGAYSDGRQPARYLLVSSITLRTSEYLVDKRGEITRTCMRCR